jgi:hypothetical protein
MLYSFFYHSDFRSSSYIDLWLQTVYKHTSATMGIGNLVTRKFDESQTQFIVYLTGIIPLLSYVTFKRNTLQRGLADTAETIRYVLYFYTFFSVSNLLGMATGLVPVIYYSNRLWNAGGIIECIIFLLFTVTFYLHQQDKLSLSKTDKNLLIFNLVYLTIFILLGVKKGSYISLSTGLILFFICLNLTKPNLFCIVTVFKKYGLLLTGSIGTLVVAVTMLPLDSASQSLFDIINNRFTDSGTFEIRKHNWQMYTQFWLAALNWFTALFGFGTDASREAAFFITSTSGNTVLHIHNLFMEVFYNYGLCGLLYFSPFLYGCFTSLKTLFFKKQKEEEHTTLKIYAAISLAISTCLMVYYTSETNDLTSSLLAFSVFSLIGLFPETARPSTK